MIANLIVITKLPTPSIVLTIPNTNIKGVVAEIINRMPNTPHRTAITYENILRITRSKSDNFRNGFTECHKYESFNLT